MGALSLDGEHLAMAVRLVIALVVGGLIGLERSYHGRPAGFRTHALVALSTALLMFVPIFAAKSFPGLAPGQQVTIDPTRMAQGIMTGIGFLGAGAIIRDGMSIRGLTTAASIWVTAAIGILIGGGFYFPAAVASVFTLGTLSVFRWIEARIPTKFYAHLDVRFRRNAAPDEPELRALIGRHGFRISSLNYTLDLPGDFFEYRMTIQASRASKAPALTDALTRSPAVLHFHLAPTAD